MKWVAALALGATVASGCARPYRGPKTLAAIGTGLLAAGSVGWIAGERGNHPGLITPSVITAVVGAAAVIGAGGWLAASIACSADPDCPEGEQCKELPAPPGGVPYRQCVIR
jgi:hypothetical protein